MNEAFFMIAALFIAFAVLAYVLCRVIARVEKLERRINWLERKDELLERNSSEDQRTRHYTRTVRE
jgi:hypothetical protein